MSDQNRCGNTSDTARYRCDRIYDRLYFIVSYVTAEFAFCIDIDADIDDHLSGSYTPDNHGHALTNTGDTDLVFMALIILD